MNNTHRFMLMAAILASVALGFAAGQEVGQPFTVVPTELLLRGESISMTRLMGTNARDLIAPARVIVVDPSGAEFSRADIDSRSGARWLADAPLPAPDAMHECAVIVEEASERHRVAVRFSRPTEGRVLHFIAGFHYDPVWWNTQANYCERGERLDAHIGPGLELVERYLDLCAKDPDYKVALHQLPYLRTFLEARPGRRAELMARIAEGRVAIVGGSYDEMQSTLISGEAIIRNAILGTRFQREILGGDGAVAWQCDVFGHDPSFPSLMAAAGHDAAAFARGPFHQWGAPRDLVNFPSEFEWMSPDGRSVLAHYMTGHYGYAYSRLASGANRTLGPEFARLVVAEMFEDLRRCALTRHILLPMHMDFIRPLEDLGDIARDWNSVYSSPRAEISTPRAFFEAVRADCKSSGIVPPVITRDMNPVYTGCGASFADLKTANRAAESALRDAEVFSTVDWLTGGTYPYVALDRAWRQLAFLAHHDGITGSMSDQVYVDMLSIVRDALVIGEREGSAARRRLADRMAIGDGVESVAFNSMAAPRAGSAVGEAGGTRPTAEIPAIGWAPLAVTNSGAPSSVRDLVLENENLRVVVDLTKGGALTSLFDKRGGRECLSGPGNEIAVYPEYASLPGHGEGPWHIAPKGERIGSLDAAARLLPTDAARPHRLTVESNHGAFTARRSYELEPGSAKLACETTIVDFRGRDLLVRAEFPFAQKERPVHQLAASAIVRPFARRVDAAVDPWTLDQVCGEWLDIAPACRVLYSVGGIDFETPIGVGEIVIPDDASYALASAAGRLARALVRSGVTTTITRRSARRYGDIGVDSNLPDFRIEIDGPAGSTGHIEIPAGPVGVIHLPQDERVIDIAAMEVESRHIMSVGEGAAAPEPMLGVAVISHGVVSTATYEDGVTALNLLRSCTGWPSGTWIDGPPRRLPDGAPFETMHGTHAFRYDLMPHDGDFREAELAFHGQDANVPLRSVAVSAHPGDLAAAYSAFSVTPRTVLLRTLRPADADDVGAWRDVPTPTGFEREVEMRLWNGAGRAVRAVVTSGFEVRAARSTDLLGRTIAPLASDGSEISLDLGANETVTLRLSVVGRTPLPIGQASAVSVAGMPSAYWLENLGEGADRAGALAVAPSARELTMSGPSANFDVSIINNGRGASAVVDLAVVGPIGGRVAISPSTLVVPPGSVMQATVDIERGDALSMDGFVRIEAKTSDGRVVTAHVRLLESKQVSTATGDRSVSVPFDVDLLTPLVTKDGTLRARVRNRGATSLLGRAEWIMPAVNWPHARAHVEEIEIGAASETEVVCQLAGARPSWALLRFAAAGHVAYGETAAIVEGKDAVVVRAAADRIRLRKSGGDAVVIVRRFSDGGVDATSRFDLEAGWQSQVIASSTSSAAGCESTETTFRLTPPADAPTRGTLRLRGGADVAIDVPYSIAETLRAKAGAGDIAIDGDLREWHDAEFVSARSTLGSVRCAVRYESSRLVLAFDVRDEKHVQTKSGASIWEGDSVQFALSPSPSTSTGYSAKDLEFGAALTTAGPLLWCWYGGERGITGRIESRLAIRRDGDHTFYEIEVPRAAVPSLPLEPGNLLGFSFIANDDDGAGYAGATQWTGGMVGTKDSSLFGELEL